LGRIDQSTVDTSFVPERHPGARARWAIQIATVDSFKWRGSHKLASFLGRNSVEHSFTRMAQIWCDEDGKPLKDPETGRLYPQICVRGELNPGAIDPKTGEWTGLRIDPHTVGNIVSTFIPRRLMDAFNNAVFKSKKCKLGVFSWYGDGIEPLDADYVVEEPVAISDDQDCIEALWAVYQERAEDINRQGLDYDLVRRNCHTVNAVLNAGNVEAVERFAKRGFMRWGAKTDAIKVAEDTPPVVRSLEELQKLNCNWADGVCMSCQRLAGRGQLHSEELQDGSHELSVEYAG